MYIYVQNMNSLMVPRIFFFLDTCQGSQGAAGQQQCPSGNCLWKKNPSKNHKEKTGNKLGKKKKSTPTSFEAVFFLVAAKGLNNDRYNGKNVGWLVKRRAYIKQPPYSLRGVKGVVHDIRNRPVNSGCSPTGFTEPWRQW